MGQEILYLDKCKCHNSRTCSIIMSYVDKIEECPCQQCLVKIMCDQRCKERRRYFQMIKGNLDTWNMLEKSKTYAKDVK
jgi:hypothetical protein